MSFSHLPKSTRMLRMRSIPAVASSSFWNCSSTLPRISLASYRFTT